MGRSASESAAGLVLRAHSGASYRFDPGALCLELVTTGGPGAFARYEVLHTPADLLEWAERSRLTPTPALEVSDAELAATRRVRNALLLVAMARAEGDEPDPADIATINEAAARPPLVPVIGPGARRAWARPATGTQLLATVARDAVELLTGRQAHRIRRCAGERCYLLFVDTSRPGRRRWCSMEHCGNVHKVRSLRARRARPDGEAPKG